MYCTDREYTEWELSQSNSYYTIDKFNNGMIGLRLYSGRCDGVARFSGYWFNQYGKKVGSYCYTEIENTIPKSYIGYV